MPAKFLVLAQLAVRERLDRLEAERDLERSEAAHAAWDEEHDFGNDIEIYRMIDGILTEAMESRNGG